MSERAKNRRAVAMYIRDRLQKLTLQEQHEVLTFELARIKLEAFEEREAKWEALASGSAAALAGALRIKCTSSSGHEWEQEPGFLLKCKNCGAAGIPSGTERAQ